MHLDVQDLRNFYYRSALGRAAQRAVRDQLVELWPEATGQTMVGYGFAVPLLRPYLGDARRIIGLMPGPQGVMPWPAGMPNVSVLCEETLWPVDTGRVDRLVMLHGLETSERPANLLDEAYRVLGPGGRAMFIVPHRGGLWSRSDKTPFGYGRPYTISQLENQLRVHGFMPERTRTAIFRPPSHRRFWLKAGPMADGIGKTISPLFPGSVLFVEASKRVQAPSGPGLRARARRPLDVLAPPKPETAPV